MGYTELLPGLARGRASKQRQTYKIAFRNQNTSQNPGVGQDGTAKVSFLIATIRFIRIWWPLSTTPIPPWPILSRIT